MASPLGGGPLTSRDAVQVDGEAGLGGRQQLQRHVELRRAEVSQMLRSAHFSHLEGENKGRQVVKILPN